MNIVALTGNLTRDSEYKIGSTGIPMCRFSMAVNKRYKGEEEVSFFDVVLFDKVADALHEYLVKGKHIALEGELKQLRWEDEGVQKSRVEIVGRKIDFLS